MDRSDSLYVLLAYRNPKQFYATIDIGMVRRQKYQTLNFQRLVNSEKMWLLALITPTTEYFDCYMRYVFSHPHREQIIANQRYLAVSDDI